MKIISNFILKNLVWLAPLFVELLRKFLMKNVLNFIARHFIWLIVLIAAIYLQIYLKSHFAIPEINALLTGIVAWSVSKILAEITLFSFTSLKFIDESKENIGRIYQGTCLVIAVVFAGYYFTSV